jgi:hypothetical protein
MAFVFHMYIRRLPARIGVLFQKKNYAPNHVYFNPSADGPYTYIRVTEHTKTTEINHIMIHNADTCNVHLIPNPSELLKDTCGLFTGLEDLRIVVFKERIWFTATCTHASWHMNNQMVVGRFNEHITKIDYLQIADIAPMPVKNVCPFVYDDALHLLDTYKQKVWRVNEIENGLDFEVVRSIKHAHGDGPVLRGSTSPVHLHGNTWGFIVHDIIFNDSAQLVTRLSYFHHWVEMDMERGVITYISSPFWIYHWGIEYVSGIKYVRERDEIEIYFGVMDQTPVKAVTTLANLRCGK